MELFDQVCSFHNRMREIKFRAWHKHFKQMSNTIMTLGDAYFGFPNRSELRYWLHVEDMEVMQFTGLKDKDGKEIYEGDIIHGPVITDTPYTVQCPSLESFHWYQELADAIEEGKQIEVIGNIYQNAELLKAA
jgi:hypothetical protein